MYGVDKIKKDKYYVNNYFFINLVMFVIPIKAKYVVWFFIFLNIIAGRSI